MGFFDSVGGFISNPIGTIIGGGWNEVAKPVVNWGYNDVVKPVVGAGVNIVNRGANWVEAVGNKAGNVLDSFTNPLTMIAVLVGAAIIIPLVLNKK